MWMLSNSCRSICVLFSSMPLVVPPSPTKCFAQAATFVFPPTYGIPLREPAGRSPCNPDSNTGCKGILNTGCSDFKGCCSTNSFNQVRISCASESNIVWE